MEYEVVFEAASYNILKLRRFNEKQFKYQLRVLFRINLGLILVTLIVYS